MLADLSSALLLLTFFAGGMWFGWKTAEKTQRDPHDDERTRH